MKNQSNKYINVVFAIVFFFFLMSVGGIFNFKTLEAQSCGAGCPTSSVGTCGANRCTRWLTCYDAYCASQGGGTAGLYECFEATRCADGSYRCDGQCAAASPTPTSPGGGCGPCGCDGDCRPQCFPVLPASAGDCDVGPKRVGDSCTITGNPGTCSGAPNCICQVTCISTDPNAPVLVSPANGAVEYDNNVDLSYIVENGWGNGCPATLKNYSVYYKEDNSGVCAAGGYINAGAIGQLNNLLWGSTYCWYVTKNNGSKTLSSPTWRFRIQRTPTITGSAVLGDVCGFGQSGQAGQTGVSNPITFHIEFTDYDNLSVFQQMIFSMVPTTGPWSDNRPDIDAGSAFLKGAQSNSLSFTMDLASGISTIAPSGSSSYTYEPSVWTGNKTNAAGTATVLDIQGATKLTVDLINHRMTADVKVRFENSFPSGTYNLYATALMQAPDGSTYTAYAHPSIGNYAFHRFGTWTVDVVKPAVSIGGPTFNPSGSFNMVWNASDNLTPLANLVLRAYMRSPGPAAAMQDETQVPITTINNIVPGPALITDTPNVNLTAPATKIYRDMSPSVPKPDYQATLFATDRACNVGTVTSNIGSPSPWLLGYQGIVSANGGILGLTPPLINPFTVPFNTTDNANVPYVSTYSLLSGDTNMPAVRQSRYTQFSTSYKNLASKPPLDSGFTTWYDYLKDLLTNNTTIVNSSAAIVLPGTRTSAAFGVAPNSKAVVQLNGGLELRGNNICDTQTIVLVNGGMQIVPDFTNQSASNACIFIVKLNVQIAFGTNKTPSVPTSSATLAGYDIADTFIFIDGSLLLPLDLASGPGFKGDGLYINGGIVTNLYDSTRDIGYAGNFYQPSVEIRNNPKFLEIFRAELATNKYNIREIN